MFWRKCVYRFPDHGRYMTTVWGATAGLCTTETVASAFPDDRRSAMLPSALRRVVVLSSCALTVTVVSPRPPRVGETSNPPPVVVSDHASVDDTVNAASEPAVLRSTTSSCVVVSPARSSVFSHPASSVTASSSHSVRRIICRYGVSGC